MKNNWRKEFRKKFVVEVQGDFELKSVNIEEVEQFISQKLKERDEEWKSKIKNAIPKEIGFHCFEENLYDAGWNDCVKEIKEKLK